MTPVVAVITSPEYKLVNQSLGSFVSLCISASLHRLSAPKALIEAYLQRICTFLVSDKHIYPRVPITAVFLPGADLIWR